MIVSIGRGLDLVESVEKLRHAAVRRDSFVDAGFTVEDGHPIVAGLMKA